MALAEAAPEAVETALAAVVDPLVAAGAAPSRRSVLKRATLPRLGRRFG
jgi:hypothetical protein